jgi:hypothetical protein
MKFNYIKKLSNLKTEHFSIPRFCEIGVKKQNSGPILLSNFPYILRSSLQGEGGEKLKPGISLSIQNINSQEQFTRSLEQVRGQKNLDVIILQEQINISEHITGVFINGVSYLQVRRGEKIRYCVLSPSFYIGEISDSQKLSNAILEFCSQDIMTFELGIKNDATSSLQLFQLTEIKKTRVDFLLNNGPFSKIYKNIENYSNGISFKEAISILLRSFLLRRFDLSFKNTSKGYLNWNCIMFYFSLYQRQNNHLPFSDFISWARNSSHWMALSTFEHIKLAQKYTKTWNLSAGFLNQAEEIIYIGYGRVNSSTFSDLYFLESLEPSFISKCPKGSLLFTSDSHILGHGYLLCVEKDLLVIGNLTLKKLNELRSQENIYIDFENKKILLD